MNAFFLDYGLFLAKALTWLVVLLALLFGVLVMVRAARAHRGGAERLQVDDLGGHFRDLGDVIRSEVLDGDELKALARQRKAEARVRAKSRKRDAGADGKPRVYVLKFDGDLQASAVESLREEISALLQVLRPETDEVVLRLDSEGGMVHGYGLAASQLVRLRKAGVRLTVAVDKVAASGGYLMACVADRVIAAPFAIVGSIGVVAQMPNFHKLLQRFDIDYELHTAGAYKRTLTLFGENTDAAREKFREELEQVHALFKGFVGEYRPQLDIERVATGEHWFGTQALALNLVDGLQTSDDYLLERSREAAVLALRFRRRQPLSKRMSEGLVRLGLALRLSAAEAAQSRWQ